MYFYSAKTGGLYVAEVNGANMPPDAKEICVEEYTSITAAAGEGKVVLPDPAGHPVISEPMAPSIDQLRATERTWRENEIATHEWLVSRHRAELDLQRATTLSAERFRVLLEYLQTLRDWPAAAAFPVKAERPVEPSWLAELTP